MRVLAKLVEEASNIKGIPEVVELYYNLLELKITLKFI
jgi:hypothetical protein